MMATEVIRTKRPTPLSTRALAAFMTWKQFDVLLILRQEGASSATAVSQDLEEIQKYDMRHGGAFYESTSYSAAYSCLSTLQKRRLVDKFFGDTGYIEWTLTDRGRQALEGLE